MNGELAQVVLPTWEYEILATKVMPDRLGSSTWDLEALRERLVAEVSDIANSPPARFHIVHLTARVDLLIVVMNHLACDGWGFKLLIDELTLHYRCDVDGRMPPPPRSGQPPQPKDQAIWESSPEGSAVLESGLTYWQSRLQKAPPILQLPRRSASARPASGLSCSFTLSADLMTRVAAIAARQNCTPFHFFLAIMRVLIIAMADHDDVVIGSTYLNRRPQFMHVVGQFSKTLFLRERVDRSGTFTALMIQVRDGTLDAYAHAAYSSSALHDWGLRDAWARGTPIPRWNATSFEYNFPRPGAKAVPNPKTTAIGSISSALPPISGLRLELDSSRQLGGSGLIAVDDSVAGPDELRDLLVTFLSWVERCSLDRQVRISDLQSPRVARRPAIPQLFRARGLDVDLKAIETAIQRVPGVLSCAARVAESRAVGDNEILARVKINPEQVISPEDLASYAFRCLHEVPYTVMPHRMEVQVDDEPTSVITDSSGVCADGELLSERSAQRTTPKSRPLTATERKLLAAVGWPAGGIHTKAWDVGVRICDMPRLLASLEEMGLRPVPGLAWLFALPLSLFRVAAWIDLAGGHSAAGS
jgi:hypothetical protein